MSARPPARRRALLVATAITGVVAAHVVDYLVVFPERAERSQYLDATGHGYWPTAIGIAVVAAVVAIVLAVVIGARRSRHGRPGHWTLVAGLWRLATGQMALFTVLELSERLLAGLSPSALLAPAFVTGMLVQVAVAAIALLTLYLVETVSAKVTAVLRRGVHGATRRSWMAPAGSGWRSTPLASAARPRAPPSLLLS